MVFIIIHFRLGGNAGGSTNKLIFEVVGCIDGSESQKAMENARLVDAKHFRNNVIAFAVEMMVAVVGTHVRVLLDVVEKDAVELFHGIIVSVVVEGGDERSVGLLGLIITHHMVAFIPFVGVAMDLGTAREIQFARVLRRNWQSKCVCRR